jgi:hypothetical protein
MKKYILAIALAFGLGFGSNQLLAQPGFDDDVEDTPIDGGISLLVGAGIAYGFKKVKDQKKK